MTIRIYRMTRDVVLMTDTIKKGEIVFEYFDETYGVIASGVAISRVEGETPFYEVPLDAIEPVNPGDLN